MNTTKTKINKKELINSVEAKFLKENLIQSDTSNNRLEVGDILRIGYMVYEGNKERTQYYEGVVIAIQNKGLGKSFTIRRTVQGIGIEQIFLLNSPKFYQYIKNSHQKYVGQNYISYEV